MISLIICSSLPDISPALRQNIEATIGIEYELLVIDNSTNRYSIFEAYNAGLQKSKYTIHCFMHEDILYHTQDWGSKVIQHFQNPEIGLIGIAGTKYVGKVPAFWSDYFDYNEHNLIQSDKTKITATHEMLSDKCNTTQTTNVAVVDGVWFCLNNMKSHALKFDTDFAGFHFYDMDICMQVRKAGLQVAVVYNIIVEHFSWGSVSRKWIDNAFLFYGKWAKSLPYCTQTISPAKIELFERRALIKLIKMIDYYKAYHYLNTVLKYSFSVLGLSSLSILYRYKRVFMRGYFG